MWLLSLTSLISTAADAIKESLEKPIPAENWANKELMHKDRMSGMSEKEIMKNLERGRYKGKIDYPEPHRDSKTGKIMIENCKLYYEDLKKYDAIQVGKWVKQGKYNLTPEELEKERARIKQEYDKLHDLLR